MKPLAIAILFAGVQGFLPPPARGTPPELDKGKRMIERPARLLASGGGVDLTAGARVEPGLVRWHADFDAARAAAGKSGKPILLFQMMGRLDDRFC